MSIDFFDENNRMTYAKRPVDHHWSEIMKQLVPIQGKRVADIGCGGGIYSKQLVAMGAASVIAIDFSEEMLKGAAQNGLDTDKIKLHQGRAQETGLENSIVDVILERALIHHLNYSELFSSAKEAYRLLTSGGGLLIQDRTPEDCLIKGSPEHIRGYIFEKYPELAQKEIARRHDSRTVTQILEQSGFIDIKQRSFWEVRNVYPTFKELEDNLLQRVGRSILYELEDQQLKHLVSFIKAEIQKGDEQPIIEKDRWTVWVAKKA
ncbi:ubiquinone/menaquinone biosynthesis C-methylase UbiE [Pullulanibacillus pueri]|uniref:Methyltransferase n=1 Tax=Pullulanibacillus pueri TaxID=1437324 RepID=A0A8J3EKV0_9BACL|nr:class I SAM-dependent methyltransferase [Pullulanibacillus pueri]MBM7680033.1 ubiquinone/menaquinone biosynthesis C-methylase UbiE [Pullulanibacillus pueri]GGH74031.1 methyltransferase [Pullulanibacillus pueri]